MKVRGTVRSLREWLLQHQWFIVECDPCPGFWCITALSPSGEMWSFVGSVDVVRGWDRKNSFPV